MSAGGDGLAGHPGRPVRSARGARPPAQPGTALLGGPGSQAPEVSVYSEIWDEHAPSCPVEVVFESSYCLLSLPQLTQRECLGIIRVYLQMT